MNIAIFCSANDQIDRRYFDLAADFARWCAHNGHSIVFGGCRNGLMGCVAEAFYQGVQEVQGVQDDTPASEAPGIRNSEFGINCGIRNSELIGIVPRIIEQGGRTSEHLTVHIPCDNLSDRKDLMLAHSDVVVALPGGIGTLDEVFTVAAAHTIGYHRKPVILYNMDGFWDTLVRLLDDLQQRGMIRGHWSDYIRLVSTPAEIHQLLTPQK